jgi:hypothetical protein
MTNGFSEFRTAANQSGSSAYASLQIVIPVYNDWESVSLLLPIVDEQLRASGVPADVLLVDDGSTLAPPRSWNLPLTGTHAIRILRLKRNVGHQRAICIGLCFLSDACDCERVMVMDGDGEDAPADIPRLLKELQENDAVRIVFAERLKRSEGMVFSFFYAVYRMAHWVLVGHRVRVGNFSVMNRECLESLCVSPEMWNHYAAAVYATRQPKAFVPTRRAQRLAGTSSMNFPALVTHGLSALSVFSDRISTRLLMVSLIAGLMAAAVMLFMALLRITTGYVVSGWAATIGGAVLLFLVQIIALVFTFCFLVLITRGQHAFIPAREYGIFVRNCTEVWHADAAERDATAG